jgi:hypothetical protein
MSTACLSCFPTTIHSLFGNAIGGEVPTELGQLTKMAAIFQLYSNDFTGSIPSQVRAETHSPICTLTVLLAECRTSFMPPSAHSMLNSESRLSYR